jgi:hypothetical protein
MRNFLIGANACLLLAATLGIVVRTRPSGTASLRFCDHQELKARTLLLQEGFENRRIGTAIFVRSVSSTSCRIGPSRALLTDSNQRVRVQLTGVVGLGPDVVTTDRLDPGKELVVFVQSSPGKPYQSKSGCVNSQTIRYSKIRLGALDVQLNPAVDILDCEIRVGSPGFAAKFAFCVDAGSCTIN